MEAKAMVVGLIEIDKHWPINPLVEVESDYLEVVRLLNFQDFDFLEVDFFFVKEALSFPDFVIIFHICKVSREENKVAHKLNFFGILFQVLLSLEKYLSSSYSSPYS